MYRRLAILLIMVLFLISAVQPAFAAGTKIAELRLQATKAFVTNSIDSAINVLGNAENAVDRSALKESQKAGLKSRIEANITWLDAKKADVNASTSVAEVLANAREANQQWNGVYPELKKEIGLMACDNVDEVIATARGVAERVDALKARGKDTAAIENALAAYGGRLDNAARHAANARSEFNAIDGKYDGHYAAGFRQLVLAQNELRGAYADLKNIYRLFYGDRVPAGSP